MSIDTLPEHIRRPHLRPIQPIPVAKDGQQFVALRDPVMLSQQTIVIPVQAFGVLQHFRGERSLEQLAEQFQGNLTQFIDLAKGLDTVGLLWGPTADALEEKLLERLKQHGAFPPTASASLGKDDAACRTAIDEYFAQTDDPELGFEPAAIVAPHLDYQRGWPNYAAAYFGWRKADAPDRVVILGTNHFGSGDGVVLSEFGFESPLGRCPVDAPIIQQLSQKLGRPLIVDQLDHVSEHSIQLQVPWLQYCFGNVPLVAALIPDPLTPMIADDGARVDGQTFANALAEAVAEAGGRTLYVASSDLSHVGPQFGEPRPVDEQRRFDVERHDREMMAKFLDGDGEEFLAAMRWNKNPTRWCSIGNMAAILRLVQPEQVELIDYRQAYDDKGMALVSSAALAMS